MDGGQDDAVAVGLGGVARVAGAPFRVAGGLGALDADEEGLAEGGLGGVGGLGALGRPDEGLGLVALGLGRGARVALALGGGLGLGLASFLLLPFPPLGALGGGDGLLGGDDVAMDRGLDDREVVLDAERVVGAVDLQKPLPLQKADVSGRCSGDEVGELVLLRGPERAGRGADGEDPAALEGGGAGGEARVGGLGAFEEEELDDDGRLAQDGGRRRPGRVGLVLGRPRRRGRRRRGAILVDDDLVDERQRQADAALEDLFEVGFRRAGERGAVERGEARERGGDSRRSPRMPFSGRVRAYSSTKASTSSCTVDAAHHDDGSDTLLRWKCISTLWPSKLGPSTNSVTTSNVPRGTFRMVNPMLPRQDDRWSHTTVKRMGQQPSPSSCPLRVARCGGDGSPKQHGPLPV